MTTKQLNIKNRSYYFYNDLINVLGFEAGNLKLDKKDMVFIYHISYIDKKPDWNVNSLNSLYLMINRFYGHIEEENGVKYLIISDVSRNSDVLKKYIIWCFLELSIISKKLIIVIVNMTRITRKLNF